MSVNFPWPSLRFRVVALGLSVLLLGGIALLGWRLKLPPAKTQDCAADSPILVRGRSMTAFTTGANGWQPSGSAYCADVDTSSITFENAGEPQNSNSWTGWPKSKTWRVVIHGHDAIDYPNDTTPSNNGMGVRIAFARCSAIADDGNMSVVCQHPGRQPVLSETGICSRG